MVPEEIPIPLPGGLTTPLPRMVRATQRFVADKIADVGAHMAAEMRKLSHVDLRGKSVAVAVGSRGIRSQPPVVIALIDELRKAGAAPFVVPAMGSHGGGTAEGQQKIVEGYSMGEAETGAPIRSSMDVVKVADVGDMPVYCDRNAYEADHIIAVNRVKPHTSFRGPVESGLCKMLVIGLGKHTGAVEFHRRGMAVFGTILPPTAEAFIAKLGPKLLGAVAIVENGYERLHTCEIVPPQTLVARDTELQALSKTLIPRLLLNKIDILIVDQIGKDISGAGLDPNVTGRNASNSKDFGGPDIHRIIVRDLTPGTEGNATGMGVADLTTLRLVRKINWTKTYVNLATAGSPGGAALPMVANNDREALYLAMRSCPMATAEGVRAIRIENTLDLGEIWISEALAAEAAAHPDMDVTSEPFDLAFDDTGHLTAFG